MTNLTPERLAEIKARCEAITMGEGDWHRMKYDDGSLMPDYISAGQTKEGYSLDVIISECEKVENVEFIVHAPTDLPALIVEVERLQPLVESQPTLLDLVERYAAVLEEGHSICANSECVACKELKKAKAAIKVGNKK